MRTGLWEGWAAQAHLEGYGRATAVQLLAGGTLVQVVHHGGVRVGLALLAAVGIGFVGVQLNAVLVAVAVRLGSPEVRWRQLLGQRADVLLDLLELTVGTVIAAAWIASPAAALALPAMIYLHRSLTHNQLCAAARTDAKTGLFNAATWQEKADREVSRATRTHAPLTVLIADLDRFRKSTTSTVTWSATRCSPRPPPRCSRDHAATTCSAGSAEKSSPSPCPVPTWTRQSRSLPGCVSWSLTPLSRLAQTACR